MFQLEHLIFAIDLLLDHLFEIQYNLNGFSDSLGEIKTHGAYKIKIKYLSFL